MSVIILVASMFPMAVSVFLADLFKRKQKPLEHYEEDTPIGPI